MAPSGIETATFRLVVQSLNQLRHRVPSVIVNCDCVAEHLNALYGNKAKFLIVHYDRRYFYLPGL